MTKNIEPKLKKIGEYLKIEDDAAFSIPEYQRAYSWQIDNCDKLWQDIVDYTGNWSKDSHFFGTIILSMKDNDSVLELIDGQQRTTTFILLLKALLLHINNAIENESADDESVTLYRALKDRRRDIIEILYKVDRDCIPETPNAQTDREFYKRNSNIKNHSITEQYSSDLDVILQSVDFNEAMANVTQIKYKQNDNKYTNFFKNYKFFYEKISELKDSNLNLIAKNIIYNCELIEIKSWQFEQAINMFNSLNSDGMPLYDSDIITAQLYAAAKEIDKENEFSKLWSELLNQTEELKDKGIADINSIMYQYMYYIRTVNGETTGEKGTINVTTPGLRRYFIDVNKEPVKDPIKMSGDMLRLINAWKKISEYPITKVLFKFNENTKLFLATYLLRSEDKITQSDVETIIESLLRLFAILELVDSGYSSKNFKTFLFGEEIKMADDKISVEMIKNDFTDHIRNNWNIEAIKDAVKDYNRNMLVYLNEYLFAKEKGLDFNLDSKYDIEHIMPSSGSNLQNIRNDAGIEDDEDFRGVVNKLGNKIILEEKINRSIGNEWFRTKVSTKLEKKTGYIDSKYPLANALVSEYRNVDKPFWKKEDILNATEKAGERISNFIFKEI